MNQYLAQVYVASLTDAEQLPLPPGRVLAGHDAEPCCELSPLPEGGPVTDGSDDGRRHDRSDAGDLADACAPCVAGRDPLKFIVQSFDLLLNVLPLAPQHVDQVAHL